MPAVMEADGDHTPDEPRFAGLDRRTVAPGLAVLALAAVLNVALPAIDDAMRYDVHVETGETISLKSVSFTPAADWGVVTEDGADAADPPATERVVVGEGTSRFGLTVTDTALTAEELLDEAGTLDPGLDDVRGFHVAGTPSSYTTTQGVAGTIERFTGVGSEGFVAAFVDEGVGVIVVVSAAENQLREHTGDINDMLDSVEFERAGEAATEEQS